MEKIYDYTIKLLRYVLKGDVPTLPDDIDFYKLYEFGRSHGVENMLYVGLKGLNIDVPKDVFQKFYYSYLMSIKIDTLQTMELEKIGKAFEDAGIDYIPLKGSVVKYFYPMPNYRKSGDIDVLIRREDKEKAKYIFAKQLGYMSSEDADRYEVHIVYVSKTNVHIELHKQILKKANRAYKTFKSIWKYANQSENKAHEYKLSAELLYTYQLAHLCHHIYHGGGAGIRMLMDFYVLKQSMEINSDILHKCLKKSNLTTINNYVRLVIDKWFEDSYSTDKATETLMNIILSGGSFGTYAMKEKIHNSMGGIEKIRCLLRRVFLSSDRLKQSPDYAAGTNSKTVMHLRRLKHVLLYGRKNALDETKHILKSDKSDESLKKIANAVCER